MKKRLISILLALCMVLALVPGTALGANAPATSGSCGAKGSNVTWSFNQSSGTLTISGSGAMADYDEHYVDYLAPDWAIFTKEIKTVVISEGITHVGDSSFGGASIGRTMENLTSVQLPNTLISIGKYAFSGSHNLKSITFSSKLRSIGNSAFYNSGLTSVNFPSSLTTIEDAAFQSTKLTSVYIGANVTKLGTYGGNFIFASPSLAAITVDPANPNYASESGVLYNKAKTQLITYPLGSTTKHFVLPATLKGDLELALFWETRELESITIPASVNLINEWNVPDAVLGTEHLGKPITLNFEGSIPDTSKWEFLGVESMRTIVVKSVGGGQPGTSYL